MNAIRISIIIFLNILTLNMNAQTTTPEMKKLQAEMIDYAFQVAENVGVKLDYSDSSIILVEHVLAEINREYELTKDETGLYGLAMEFGLYIMKVIEQNHGPAYFERDHKDFGEYSFPLYWRNSTTFPVGWCLKRILDGEGDDVWLKYQIFVLDKK